MDRPTVVILGAGLGGAEKLALDLMGAHKLRRTARSSPNLEQGA